MKAASDDVRYMDVKMLGIGHESDSCDYYYLIDSIPWYPNNSNKYYCRNEARRFGNEPFVRNDTTRLIELYFRNPIPAPDSFFLGASFISNSNGDCRSCHYLTSTINNIEWRLVCITRRFYDGSHVIYRYDRYLYSDNYISYPFIFAIRQRPDSSLLPQNHMADCPRPNNFRLQYKGDNYLWLAWDTTGMDVKEYEVAWGLNDPDGMPYIRIDSTKNKVKIMQLDTMAGYSRQFWIRTRCHHVCGMHDTVAWGHWSAPLAVLLRDTTHDTLDILSPEWNNTQLTLLPNPASRMLTVKTNDGSLPKEVEMLDLQGRVILRQYATTDGGDCIQLDVSLLPAGTYLVRVHSSKGITGAKAVIK